MLVIRFFFVKPKTAYEMRISDWSSDVCSSDLDRPLTRLVTLQQPFSDNDVRISTSVQSVIAVFERPPPDVPFQENPRPRRASGTAGAQRLRDRLSRPGFALPGHARAAGTELRHPGRRSRGSGRAGIRPIWIG